MDTIEQRSYCIIGELLFLCFVKCDPYIGKKSKFTEREKGNFRLNSKGMRHIFWLILLLFLSEACTNKVQLSRDELIEQKVDSVLSLMTVKEKIGQLNLLTSNWDVTGPTIRKDYEDLICQGNVGSIFNAYTVAYVSRLQKIAVEETRLKIPLLFGYDVIHGHRTIFPIPLGQSCSWDMDAIELSDRIAATEATALGLTWNFGPMVDITRDPRWGRIMEGAGEDTYLGSMIARARVRGFQGKSLSDTSTMLACVKHYAAYGAVQAGRDYSTVDMSEITLRNVYLPPFKAAVEENVATVMTSFNELNGIPASADKFLIDEVLRKEWGFKGFVVTDYTSMEEMILHGYAEDAKQAGLLAMQAGVDVDMQDLIYVNYLPELLNEKKVSIEQLDKAVKRVLRQKFALGLFDDPFRYCSETREKQVIYAKPHLDAARDMARKSMVLLKNENQMLPLQSKGKKIALIGPLGGSKHDVLGSWRAAGEDKMAISLLQALKERQGVEINYSKGCDINSIDKSGFAEAISAARQADVVILALGESAEMSGEASCRTNLNLPGVQSDLLKAIAETGKPIVLVLMNGRPLVLKDDVQYPDAILETWFAGTQAGYAICDVLWGNYNPSGKLTVTFPRSVGQIPLFYNMKNSGRPLSESKFTSKYLDESNSPLFPFGYGLSYTSFKYSDLTMDKQEYDFNEDINITVNVENTGKYDGEEVVQLYVQDVVGSITRPVKELKGFKKVNILSGQSQLVSFTLTSDDLAFYNSEMNFKAEAGKFKIYVGTNSQDVLETSFVLK